MVFVSTLAGNGSLGFRDGENANAMFWYPNSVAVDSLGVVYVADYRNNRIRKISNGNLSTLAGNGVRGFQDGQGTTSMLGYPYGVTVDASDNIYFVELNSNSVRKISALGNS